jgi:hypothetical protein
MKLVFFFTILLFNPFDLMAQITITSIPEKKKEIDSAPYDSTKNFLGDNVYQYIGQVLYLKEKHESLRQFGYDGFIRDYKNKSNNRRNIYKCCDNFKSKYSALAGSYFDVLDVHRHPQAYENEKLYGSTYFLELREQINGDKVYFKYRSDYEHSFPFLVVGYFEKLKDSNLGRKLVVRGINWWDGASTMTDILSGEPVSLIPGSIWEIVDLTIEADYFSIVFLIQNENLETVQISPVYANIQRFVFNYNEAKIFESKFGLEDWNYILNRKVKIGFTEEMAKLAWGEPKTINKSSHGSDQWVYEGQYLYFENGKITAWNEIQ